MTLRQHLGGYAVVGLLQWLVEYAAMLVLSQWLLPVEPANVIGRVCGAMLGFWLNGKWTFAGHGFRLGRQAMIRFAIMWLAMTALNTLAVGLVDHHAGLHSAQLSKPLADVLCAALGFLLSRQWVYRH